MGRVKNILMCFIAVIMLMGVAACSNSNVADKPTEASTPISTESPSDDQLVDQVEESTRSYAHMAGDSAIPVKAERVVTDWYYGQLVALGLKPIGTDDYVWKNHPFIEQAGTESIGQSLEKIVELGPDLIISWGAAKYEDYSKIAPTVPLELSGGPKDSVRIFGDILGREAEAEQWITQFDNNVAEARQKISSVIEAGETFTIFNIWKNTLRVYGFVNMGGYALYESLGVKPNPKVDELFRNSDEWYREISFEVIPEFAGDHIILTSYDPDGTSTILKELESSSIWSNLDAVKNGRVYLIDYNTLYFDDPIAIEKQVGLLADMIANSR
ncbi:ABC transporter substrate-binding protein [Paenibacillus senegalensis]|uniref:ABC transporter substrate-binding protein n=1 Tax=Paenibacillus senegalensis TaxID=1465766 RepID=UPI00028902D5|nr:ABC transporter substrate-binding protein [Paenibacillus senegalensis]